MADLNDYISRAVTSEAARPGAKPRSVKRSSSGKKLGNLALWVVALSLFIYEAGYWSKTLGLAGGHLTQSEVEALYDQAQHELEERFASGEVMTAPFNAPELVATVGVVEEFPGEYLLYFLDRSKPVAAREVVLSRG